jgi:hypothetical protein
MALMARPFHALALANAEIASVFCPMFSSIKWLNKLAEKSL